MNNKAGLKYKCTLLTVPNFSLLFSLYQLYLVGIDDLTQQLLRVNMVECLNIQHQNRYMMFTVQPVVCRVLKCFYTSKSTITPIKKYSNQSKKLPFHKPTQLKV